MIARLAALATLAALPLLPTARRGFPACRTEQQITAFLLAKHASDRPAMMRMLEAGTCRVWVGGERVRVVRDGTVALPLVKVAPVPARSDADTWVTLADAIQS